MQYLKTGFTPINFFRFKRFGVLIAVQSLKNMLREENSDERDLEECKELFDLVVSLTKSSYSATALFMDELASTILKDCVNEKLEVRFCNSLRKFHIRKVHI